MSQASAALLCQISCMCIPPPDMALQVLAHLESEKGLEELKTRPALENTKRCG